MARNKRNGSSKWAWGAFWLLIPALVLANHFGEFVELGIFGIITGALSVAILIYCIATLSLATLPLPIAGLYLVFQGPLDLPFISFWTVVFITIPLLIALHILLPNRLTTGGHWDNGNKRTRGEAYDCDAQIEEGDDENNAYISVQFGSVSRYLHSNNMESATLSCSFGAMEVYFDQVELSENGAEIYANCRFGAIEIYVPAHWRVIDKLSASFGNAEVDDRLLSAEDDAPTLTVKGNVAFGSIEVLRLRGSG